MFGTKTAIHQYPEMIDWTKQNIFDKILWDYFLTQKHLDSKNISSFVLSETQAGL
jgi:hypothetical protein